MTEINERYLDGRYHAKNPTLHVEDSAWKANQIMRLILSQQLDPQVVAEVGCGAGEILVQLSANLPGACFAGFELGKQAFEQCQRRSCERIEYYNSDIADGRRKSYDLLLCIDVMEHVDDYLGFLRRLRPWAGAFIFHIPLDMNAQMVFRGSPIMLVRETVGHLHYFSKDTALATLRDCGYRVGAWFYTPNGSERPTSARARCMKLPRRVLFLVDQDLTAKVLGGYSLLVYALPETS